MKKVMELWKKWFGKIDVSVVEDVVKEVSIKTEQNARKSSLLEDLEIYLFKVYDFRFNVLTEQTDYLPHSFIEAEWFIPLLQRWQL